MKKLIIALTVLGVIGCSDQGSDGMTYYKEGEESLVYGEVLLLWAQYEVDGKKMFPENPEYPMAMLYDSATVEENGVIQGVINKMKIGDSISTNISAKDLWENSFKQPLPDSIGQEAMVKVDLSIIDQMTREEYQSYISDLEARRNADVLAAEQEKLDNYVAANELDLTTTESGLRYVIHEEGTGPTPEFNQLVNVKYRGTTLDGNEFDAGTYEFPIGNGVVIQGWDEGIGYLNEGAKATLYIPSNLGYGSRGSGGAIPPFSTLIFEVELLSIKSR